ncbi:hypothetical protein J1605_022452 [Eschrichtius robustus]|uniref:60S acidic ribosomal protein P1 n=1 Tax=Eschrichtius robustus TaxID=9764 RepID=A0AB34HC08_ESCRO|nr:hypothetical protein J1605_022452 [Eschrichtius robustus]
MLSRIPTWRKLPNSRDWRRPRRPAAQRSPAPRPPSPSPPASTRPPVCTTSDATATEGKISALIKAARVNVEPFWPGLFAAALASVNLRSLIGTALGRRPCPLQRRCPS